MMRFICATLAALLPFTAAANEEWDGPAGTIVWDKDIDQMAVFTMPFGSDTYRLYLPGLYSDLKERGTFTGYYIVEGGNTDCGPVMKGADDVESKDWGSVVLMFDGLTYPSGWTAMMGPCFDDLLIPVRANWNEN